jgi:hypothetical protein
MQFLGGMLDLAVHLLRYGQLNDLGLISRMFESAVNALAVPVERPIDDTDQTAREAFDSLLSCKSLLCQLLEALLESLVLELEVRDACLELPSLCLERLALLEQHVELHLVPLQVALGVAEPGLDPADLAVDGVKGAEVGDEAHGG